MSGRGPDETADDEAISETLTASYAEAVAETEAAPDADSDADTVAASDAGSDADVELPVVARAHYEILGEHDRGGLGRILRAKDRRTGRVVAIKEILAGRVDAAERFRREALITANLQHPAIVPVYEVGQWESGEPFYAMKLVSGRSFEEAIKAAGTMAERLALLPHVIAVAEALAFAHAEGVIHRDLKPANVLVGSFGETVVIDWGLAKRIDDRDDDATSTESHAGDDDALTRAGSIMGTPAYMSPEQAAGKPLDERTDVYAVGAMLYHLLTSERPYTSSTSIDALLADLLAGPPSKITALADDAPAELVAITEKAMAHDRQRRYRTAGELAEELRKFQTGKLVGAHSYTPWQLVRRWLLRHKAPVAVAAVAALILVVFGTVTIRRIIAERDRADAETIRARRAERDAVARLASLYISQGRQALVAGRHDEAAAYLSRAYSMGTDSPGLRTLLSAAMANLDRRGRELVAKVGGRAGLVAFIRGGKAIVTNTDHGVFVSDASTGARLGKLPGMAKGAQGFSVAPDGSMIAAVDLDQTLRLFDAKSLAPLWSVPRSGGRRNKRPAFSRDGELIAAVTVGRGVDVFAARSGTYKYTLDEPTAIVGAFSPDKTRMLIGTVDPNIDVLSANAGEKGMANLATLERTVQTATMNVWDTKRNERLRAVPVGLLAVGDIAVVDDKQALVTANRQFLHVDYSTGKVLGRMRADGMFDSIALSADRTTAAVPGGSAIWLWNVPEHKRASILRPEHRGSVVDAAISSDGLFIVSRSNDGLVDVWDRPAEGVVATIVAPNGSHGSMAVHPRQHRVALTSRQPQVRLVDYAYRPRFVHGKVVLFHPTGLSLSAHSRQALISASKPSHTLVDLKTQKAYGPLMTGAKYPTWARFARQAAIAAVISDSRLATFDTTNGKQLAAWDAAGKRLGISDDGTRVAAATPDNQVGVWRADTGALLWKKKPFDAQPTRFVFSPDGKRLAAASANGDVVVLSDDGRHITRLKAHPTFAIIGGFSADGKRLLSFGGGRVARVSDAGSGKVSYQLDGQVSDAFVGPRHIIASTMDGRVSLYEPATGARVATWQAASAAILWTQCDKTEDRLIVSPLNGPVRIWDTASHDLIAELHGHHGMFIFANFTADGQHVVAVGNGDHLYRVWDMTTETRTADEIRRQLECRGRFRLDDGRLVANKPDPARCK